MEPLTADTITDEQIRELRDDRMLDRSKVNRAAIIGVAVGSGASYSLDGVALTQSEARARCAEIINARRATAG